MTGDDKKPPRAIIDPDDETKVLTSGARRCALCFHLVGDLSEKEGQIAHVDRNRANKAPDNLAFLCLPHHSIYDSTNSQHKNYTPRELKAVRAQLYEAIAAGKHHTYRRDAARPQPGLAADRQTLEALTSLMASTRTIAWLREFNFAGFSFDSSRLDGLDIYVNQKGAEHEFIDTELEPLRKGFQDASRKLLSEIAVNVFSTGSGHVGIPQDWEIDQPERFYKGVETIHSGTTVVCNTYDDLVRLAKRKLSA
jgi:hypothetical protein